MTKALLAAGAALALAGAGSPARAQEPRVPSMDQVINLSLVEALVAVGAADLAGVFGFIPEERTAMAMADYLLRDRKGLKRFIKKGQRDLRELGGVNEWDKQVYLFLVGMTSSGALPAGVRPLSAKTINGIQQLGLARPLSLQEMTVARSARRG